MSPVTEYVVQAGITLLGIAALAFLLLFAVRRWGQPPAHGPLELVSRLPLDGRRALYLVRVQERLLVLAATDQQISKLAELRADDVPDLPAATSPFASLLERVVRRPEATAAANPAQPAPSAQRERPTGDAD